jgi:antitoxin CcdA
MGIRRPVNLSLDAELVERARALGVNLSQSLEASLRDIIREAEAKAWRRNNKDSIAAANEELERNGLWSDGLRTF